MAGLTQALQQQVLDDVFLNTDYVAWSITGSGEFAGLARTAVDFDAATATTPSVKAISADILTDEATGAGAVSHFAFFSAVVGGTQKTDWEALDSPRTLAVGDQLSAAAGELFATLD
jgi:hypothetical protein